MKVSYVELAKRLNVSPLQLLAELAAMKQPSQDCWPRCDDGFEDTIRERRRLRQGLPPSARAPVAGSLPTRPASPLATLPVSEPAAAILNKLVMKGYGLKSVRVFTLIQKWVHGTTEDHVRELIRRGNLEWTDQERTGVNLVADRMPDTERIVDAYRRRQQ